MKLENEFTVKVPIDRAWEVLTDIPEIAPCLPGARLTGQDGNVYSGKVKIKVGPVTAEYAGTADFTELDQVNKHVVINAKGRDSRGSGNASALITADMVAVGDETRVRIDTDLKIAGKVAQFGKGVIGDVSKKLIDQFVACIEAKLEHDGEEVVEVAAAAEPAAEGAAPAPVTRQFAQPDEEMEALDLMDAAGGAVAKRMIPAAVAALVVLIVIYLIRRR